MFVVASVCHIHHLGVVRDHSRCLQTFAVGGCVAVDVACVVAAAVAFVVVVVVVVVVIVVVVGVGVWYGSCYVYYGVFSLLMNVAMAMMSCGEGLCCVRPWCCG